MTNRKSSRVTHVLIILAVIFLFLFSGCKSTFQTPADKDWSLKYSRSGGFGKFDDRIEISNTGIVNYFRENEKKLETELQLTYLNDVKYIINFDNLYKWIGKYKGDRDAGEDIAYKLTVDRDGEVFNFEWDGRVQHPKEIDEVRVLLDKVMEDCANAAPE